MSKDLSRINFKSLYSDPKDVTDFYSKALNNAKLYKRMSAYFSSGIFKYLKKGLPEFANNDGYMQLIISQDVNQETLNQIRTGYSLRGKENISKNIVVSEIKKLCVEEDINLFSYLIAVGKLDVRLVYKPKGGIVHDKFGIISDGIHNLVYIGSNNFTENAVSNNDEAFQVTLDWDKPSDRELEVVRDLNVLFDDMWNNKKNGVETITLPDPIVDELIKNIDYDDIKKYKNNPDYLRFDIEEDKSIILTSNINIDELLTTKKIGAYNSFLNKTEKGYRSANIIKTNEMYEFKNILEKLCLNNKISFYLTKQAYDFFNLNYRDYNLLAGKGKHIKSDKFVESSQFKGYEFKINNLLKRPLKSKQVQSAIHVIEMERSLNFSVPGSGKTATLLGAFEYLSTLSDINKKVNRLLIIGPVNCAKSWNDEYKIVSKEGKLKRPLCLINSDRVSDKVDVLQHDYKSSRVIIVNYELVTRLENELAELVKEDTMVVFDEIHRIKKFDGPKYNAIKNIIKKTRYRVALTGTPLPNGYIDLFNMISLLHDDFTKSYFQMNESFLKKDDSKYKKTGLQDLKLNERLYPFYIRVNKFDLNVPLAEPDHLIDVQTNEREKSLYYDIKRERLNPLEEAIKLIEIGCIPFKCEQDTTNRLNVSEIKEENINKYLTSKLCKFIANIKKRDAKACIWCNFVDTINLITYLLNREGYSAKAIYGETPQDTRDKIIDEFNYGDLRFIVTNPATLAESVSLHKACHEAHYLEMNYNLYQYLQSRDRIHRLGIKDTDKTNYYIYLNIYDADRKESKDIEIYEALKKKEDLMKKSIDKGNFYFGNFDNMEFENR